MSAGRERTEDIRNEEARIKRLLGLDVARLAIGADFEGQQYAPLGVNVIEFVNVSTSIAAAQTGSGGPAQVTGLSAVVNSNTQITLSWTAVAGATSYNVYFGFISGGASNLAGTVTSAGAVHSSLTPGTTYWYQVAAVNAVGEGSLSSEVSATTTAPPIINSLWLKFDNNFTDSSGLGSTVTNFGTTFATPGKFGSHYLNFNDPFPASGQQFQHIRLTSNTNLTMNLTIGFSISFWMYHKGYLGGTPYDGVLIHKCDSTSAPITGYSVEIKGSGELMFYVQTPTVFRFSKTGVTTTNTWHHIACTFNAATNAGVVYVDGVAGGSSSSSVWGISTSTTALQVGKYPAHSVIATDPDSMMYGRLDEIQYFKGIVLTPTQVTNLMNTNAP